MDNFAQGEIGEAQRQQAEAREQALQSLATKELDVHGMVEVWDLTENKFVKRTPIDAAEGIVVGSFSKDRPE